MRNEEADELRRVERQLMLGRVIGKRASGLKLRCHERVAALVAERDRLSIELARIVAGMAEMATRERAAGDAAGVDQDAAAEAALVAGDG